MNNRKKKNKMCPLVCPNFLENRVNYKAFLGGSNKQMTAFQSLSLTGISCLCIFENLTQNMAKKLTDNSKLLSKKSNKISK